MLGPERQRRCSFPLTPGLCSARGARTASRHTHAGLGTLHLKSVRTPARRGRPGVRSLARKEVPQEQRCGHLCLGSPMGVAGGT